MNRRNNLLGGLLIGLVVTAAGVGTSSVSAAPSLSVAAPARAVGDQLVATGAGFQGGTVSLHIDSVPRLQAVAGVPVGGGRGLNAALTIPAVADGPHTLIACRDISGSQCREQATATFRAVVVAAMVVHRRNRSARRCDLLVAPTTMTTTSLERDARDFVVWQSSLGGHLFDGQLLRARDLQPGEHVIKVIVTDPATATATEASGEVIVNIEEPAS